MIKEELVAELIDKVTVLTCWDHHKDKDLNFEITTVFRAFSKPPKYIASHAGYLYEYSEEVDSYAEALDAHIKELYSIVEHQLKWHRDKENREPTFEHWGFTPSPFTLVEIDNIEKKINILMQEYRNGRIQ